MIFARKIIGVSTRHAPNRPPPGHHKFDKVMAEVKRHSNKAITDAFFTQCCGETDRKKSIPATSNAVERLFSRAKLIFTPSLPRTTRCQWLRATIQKRRKCGRVLREKMGFDFVLVK